MKILVVCQHYWPEPFNITETCEELVRLNHDVSVLTGLPNYPEGRILKKYRHGANRNETKCGVKIIRVPIIARGKNLTGVNKVRRALNYLSFSLLGSIKAKKLESDYECVLVFQYSPIIMAKPGIAYSRKNKVPLVHYCFDLWPEDLLTGGLKRDGLLYRLMKCVSRRIYAFADLVLVTSPGFLNYFKNELHLDSLNCQLLPQYAEAQFEDTELSPPTESEKISFLFAGNIGGNQSVETIVAAANHVKDDKKITVDVVGAGTHLEPCESLARSMQLNNITFHGRKPIDDMTEYYKHADCMLLTLAKPENKSLVAEYTIPRKLQSYLAAGKPVIACAPGISKSIIEEADCGFSCEPSQDQELAAAMKEMAALTPDARKKMGKNAKKYYTDNYSKKLFFTKLSCYLETIKGN